MKLWIAAVLFALALLASGQSSSIVATLAGQIVSEGFIRWRLSVRPFPALCPTPTPCYPCASPRPAPAASLTRLGARPTCRAAPRRAARWARKWFP